MKQIEIKINDHIFKADLYDTATANTIFQILPIEGSATVWGEEIYFIIPVDLNEEPGAREIVEPGALGYWPAGQAFCIFFGPTPVSHGNESRT